MDYELIVTIVNKDYSSVLMESARSVGAKGGTVLKGRGAGGQEVLKLFGLTIESEKEVVLILTTKDMKDVIMKAIIESTGLTKPGMGICFSIPVDDVLGGTFDNIEKQ